MAWHCSYCPNGTLGGTFVSKGFPESQYSFNSQEEFVNHLKSCHLHVKAGRGGKAYICCYGPSGSCVHASNTDCSSKPIVKASFSTQREYEQHLVLFHLLRYGKSRQPESVMVDSTTSSSVDSPPDGYSRAWSVFQSVVNLPAVLNDPDHRQLDIFSRTWGDQFERTEVVPSLRLPVITEQHFANYLSRVTDSTASSHRTSGGGIFSPSDRRGRTPFERFPSVVADQAKRSAKPGFHPEGAGSASQLDSIPPTFFAVDFNLRHWRTFTQVIPLQQRGIQPAGVAVPSDGAPEDLVSCTATAPGKLSFARHQSDGEAPAGLRLFPTGVAAAGEQADQAKSSRCLQAKAFHRQHDKLTQYLDTVEMHLAEQVSKKSHVFFEAVFCHDVVREQLKEALLQIKVVRSKLARVDASATNSIMQLHRVVRRQQNCRALLARLHIIASLQAAQPTIQVLLRQNDFCAALDLVASTRDLLKSSPQLIVPATGRLAPMGGDWARQGGRPGQQHLHQQQLTCLRHLSDQMEEVSRIVCQMIVAEFEVVLRRFIETPNSLVDTSAPDLVPCLLGLIHIQRLDFVSAFKAELLRQVKAIVSAPPSVEASQKRVNWSTSGQSMPEPEPSVKEQLRSLSTDAWIEVVADKCRQLDGLLRYAEKAVDIFTTTIVSCVGCDNQSDATEDGHPDVLYSRAATGLSIVTVAELTNQLTTTLGNVAAAAQQHVLLLVSPRLQQGNAVETHTGGEGVETNQEGPVNDAKSGDLQARLPSKSPAAESSTAGGRLTLDQLIGLIKVLQEFLENTYRSLHHEPAGRVQLASHQLSPLDDHIGGSVQVAGTRRDHPGSSHNSSSGTATPSASKLASLVAFTVRGLIHRFHEDRCQKMKLMLQQERWEAVTVPRQLQDLMNQTFEQEEEEVVVVVDQAQANGHLGKDDLHDMDQRKSNPPVWSFRRASTGADDSVIRLESGKPGNTGPPTPRPTHAAGVESRADDVSPTLLLHGEPFMVVGSVLLLLPMLVDYAELATRLPLQPWSVEELADRVAVFLSLFNSGTCELVLGAGATKSAILQVISIRHLALASRSLQLVAKCVPPLNAYFKRLITGPSRPSNESTMANGVDEEETVAGTGVERVDNERPSHLINYLKVHHVKRKQNMLEHVDGLFSEHMSGINDKLVQLLSYRISQHLVDWQVRPPTPSSHMRLICRAICRVAQTIGEIMPLAMLTPILLRAHSEFKVKLRERLSQLMIKADGGPQQSLVDSELAFYMQQLRPLSARLTKFHDDFSDIWPVS